MNVKDRSALITDVDYFARELTDRIERLARTESRSHLIPQWQQAAKLVRAVRGLARHEADEQRHRARTGARDVQ